MALVAVAGAAGATALVAGGSAEAGAPVPTADTFTVYPAASYRLDVLANDQGTGSGDLTVCEARVDDADRGYVDAEPDGDRLLVETSAAIGSADPVVVYYRACEDGTSSDELPVTLDARQLQGGVRVARSGGTLTAYNPNDRPVRLRWGSTVSARSEGETEVPAGGTTKVRTAEATTYWVAYFLDQGAVVYAGEGELRR